MKHFIAIIFIFILYANFSNAQNEHLIREVEYYISETDSLIKHCRSCLQEFHSQVFSNIPESGGIEYSYYKKYNGMNILEFANSISEIAMKDSVFDEELWDEQWEMVDEMFPKILVLYSYFATDTITGIRKSCDSKEYYQNNELVAIVNECTENKTNIRIVDGISRYFPISCEMGVLREGKIILYITAVRFREYRFSGNAYE